MTSACVHSTEGVTAAAKFKQESSASSDNKPIERVVFSVAVMDGVGRAVVGVWRAHTVLDESDDAENSPEAPDRFRKLRSSSSLNSLRMSLRKRLPLRSVQTGSLPENPTWESLKNQPKPNPVRKLTRSARNSFTGMYQRLQKTREFSREECLVATPGQEGDNACSSNYCTPSRTPGRATTVRRTPRSAATPRRTPTSKGLKTPEGSIRGVKTGGGRRQLVRMAALRSPYASPNTQSQRLKFDQDLESVSNGLSRLQRLSKAFDDIMGKRDGPALKKRSGGAVMRKLDPSGKLSRSNVSRRASNLSDAAGSWAQTAVNTIRKSN
uniref:PICALM interacting mitotic regulator n=1 Tax=Oryzias latipes TaxID=8090 RepID=A0A3P9M218_ORYLA